MSHAPSLKAALRKPSKGGKQPTATGPKVVPVIDIPIEGSKAQQNRMAGLINKIAESPSGKATLEMAAQMGYTLNFEKNCGALGWADPEEKICTVESTSSDGEAIGTLAHELRHACQFEWGLSFDTTKITTKSKLILDRAAEADAESNACVVAWELNEKGHPEAWEEFVKQSPDMAANFSAKVKELGELDEDKTKIARTVAFKSWYSDLNIRNTYDDQHVEELQGMEDAEEKFDRNISPAKAVEIMCKAADGSSYFKEKPEILEKPAFLSVAAKTMTAFRKFFKAREDNLSIPADKSLSEVPVRKRSDREDQASNEVAGVERSTLRKAMSKGKAGGLKKASSERLGGLDYDGDDRIEEARGKPKSTLAFSIRKAKALEAIRNNAKLAEERRKKAEAIIAATVKKER